jgi:hypothetical protein
MAIFVCLEPLAVKRSPLTKPIRKPDTTWIEPKFQAEVTYGHITNDASAPVIQAACAVRLFLALLLQTFWCDGTSAMK